jgi:hypothetical protein
VRCFSTICLAYNIVHLKGAELDHASLQPLINFVVSKAEYRKLDTMIKFVHLFYDGNLDMDEKAFCLAQLQMAKDYILDFTE